MLATSCNNNDKDPVTPEPIPSTDPVVQDDGEKVIIPYTIQVGAEKKKTTKMQWKTSEGENLGITWDFSDNEVELKNKLTVTGEGVSGSLDLVEESGNYYFTGNLTAKNATVAANLRADKIELTGIYGTALSAPTAVRGVYLNESQSFDDFVTRVAQHPQLKGTFHFSDENITLVDQQIYLHIIMSPCQHKITLNGTELGLPKNGDGWVVLPATSEGDIDLNFLKIKASDLKPGKIYTIDRRGWVDLGLSDGTLWADKNYGADEIYNFGTTHTIFDAYLRLSNVTLPTGYFSDLSDGNGTDLKRLQDECHLETGAISYKSGSFSKSVIGFMVFKKKDGASATYDSETDPYIFLPYDSDMPIYWNACDIDVTPDLEQECLVQEDYESYIYLDDFNHPFHCFFVQDNQISNLFDEIPFSKADEDKYHLRPILRKNQKPTKPTE